MSQRLIIEDDEGTTTIVPLGKDAVTIGRQQGNTIQLTEKNVSRRHARLYPEQAAWVIEDLGSYNGVKVNGVPIDGRVSLKEGDVVQIGDYHLALTEDVDKRTLNYPNAGAANDSAVAEPMLASSSTDLPRLSAEELAALQSGPHAAAQPALMDSGPVPATPMPMGYEERKKGGAGLLIGFGVVLVVGLIGGVAFMASDSGDDSDKKQQVASAGDKTKDAQPAKQVQPDPVPEDAKAVDPVPTPTPTPTPPPPQPEAEVEDPPEPPPDPVDPDADVEVEDPSLDPITSPNPKKSKNRNKKNKKDPSEGTSTPPKPPKPPPPSVDPNELLKEARREGLTNPRKGYDLASQALKAGGGRAAAKLMATMACRIPDGAKAKKALARLKGSDREAVAKICRAKGIEV